MKNDNLLRRLYKLADAGNTGAALGKVLDRYQELLKANNDPDLTEHVAGVLLIESWNYPFPADWFNDEMKFETHIAGFGLPRRELALGVLRNSEISDDALDLYNARISRFAVKTPAPVSGE